MKWIGVALLWVVALVPAAALAYRLWRGRPVVLPARCPRALRLAVLLLAFLGWGGSDARGEEPVPSGGEEPAEGGVEDELPPGLREERVVEGYRRWMGEEIPARFAELEPHCLEVPLPTNAPFLERVARAQELVRGLASDDFQAREDASAALERLGQAAIDVLEGAQESADPEVASRARRILGRLRQAVEEAHADMVQLSRSLPPSLWAIVEEELRCAADSKPGFMMHASALLETLDALEAEGFIHEGVVAYFWRRLPGLPGEESGCLPKICVRLRRHARISQALVAASFGVAPFTPFAWMNKAGPRPEERMEEASAVAHILDALPGAYARADAGLWDHEARSRLTVQEGALIVARSGREGMSGVGTQVEVDRLCILQSVEGAVLDHDWIGRISVPAGRPLTVWDLPGLLEGEAAAAVRREVDSALGGSEVAAERIERALPFVHAALREGLAGSPEAPGAARLRVILALFD